VIQNSNAWDIKFHFLHQIIFQKIKNIVMKKLMQHLHVTLGPMG
jgi:hypothetical protein